VWFFLKIETATGCLDWNDSGSILCFHSSASRANSDTRTTVLAFGRIDDVFVITSCNGANGAFGFAGAAHDAIGINGVGHDSKSFR
jgi:hypothetical protein